MFYSCCVPEGLCWSPPLPENLQPLQKSSLSISFPGILSLSPLGGSRSQPLRSLSAVNLLIFKSEIGCDMTSMVHSPEQGLSECWSFPIPSSLCEPDGALA